MTRADSIAIKVAGADAWMFQLATHLRRLRAVAGPPETSVGTGMAVACTRLPGFTFGGLPRRATGGLGRTAEVLAQYLSRVAWQ